MNPVNFPKSNTVFIAEGCDSLPACRRHNDQFNVDEVISCWELSNEDCVKILKQIKAEKRPVIYLSVIGGQPPVSIWIKK